MGVLKNNRYSSVTVHSRVILLFITLHFDSSVRSFACSLHAKTFLYPGSCGCIIGGALRIH